MQQLRDHMGPSSSLIVIVVVVACALGCYEPNEGRSKPTASALAPAATSSDAKLFATTTHKPAGPPRVATGVEDLNGNEVTVGCATCHATREPNPNNKVVADLNEFHKTLRLDHGNISCLSCHNSEDYDALKLADGSRVEFADVMTLCAQCHGPQMKDYEHGAHGGMTGHWDLTKGPRAKNNCIDCHHPHSPQFPMMQPTFKPADRFLESARHGSGPANATRTNVNQSDHGEPK